MEEKLFYTKENLFIFKHDKEDTQLYKHFHFVEKENFFNDKPTLLNKNIVGFEFIFKFKVTDANYEGN
jgi:hypothetical protein